MFQRSRRIVLVTSGTGTAFGGMGVVSEMIVDALGPMRIWRHHHLWAGAIRRGALWLRAFSGIWPAPRLVLYEHLDLSILHAAVPGLGRVPYVVYLHGVEAWRQLDARRKSALLRASLLLANSETTVTSARHANPWLPRVAVTHLGVRRALRPSTPLAAREPMALMVGRMASKERYKGHDQMFDAWPTIRAAVAEATLLIAGGGDDEPRLRARARDEGLEGVQFLGHVGDAELPELYRRSRLFLFPSLREGFGLVAAEAATHGAAVLGLRGTVIEELFPGGHGTVLADRQEAAYLASAAIPVLSDPARAQAIADAGRERVESVFLVEHYGARLRLALAEWLS